MADQSQLKKNTPIDFDDNDPFAELTRIMGFDPRETVKKREPAKLEPVSANAAASQQEYSQPLHPAAELANRLGVQEQAPAQRYQPVQDAYEADESDDFGIDLEKEMLGDFAMEREEPAAARYAPPVHAEPELDEQDFEDAIAADLSADLARNIEDDLEIDGLELLGDLDEGEHDFQPRMPEYQAVIPGQNASRVQQDDEFDALDDAELLTDLEAAAEDFQPRASAEEQDEPEAYAAFEEDQAEDDRPVQPVADYARPAPALSAPAAPVATAPSALADDAGFADVDMDFGADFEEEMLSGFDAPAVSESDARPITAAAAPSLEDELNALLGNPVVRAEPARPLMGYATPHVLSRATPTINNRQADMRYPETPVRAAPVQEPAAYEAQHAEAEDQDLDELLDVMSADVEAPEAAAPELPQYDHTPFQISAADLQDDEDHESRDHGDEDADYPQPVGDDDIPEVETQDVPESVVAYQDDLDIPELDYEADAPQRSSFDDYDPELHEAYEPQGRQPAAHFEQPIRAAAANTDVDADFDALYRQVREAAGGMAYAGARQPAAGYMHQPAAEQNNDPFAQLSDEDFEEELDLPSHAAETVEPQRGRGLMIAAVVGGVALVGALGAFAMSFGGSGSNDVPVVVQADTDPVKIKPENPGGTTVPNQDNKVFETMSNGSTTAAANPSQERLVSSEEEPIDIAPMGAAPAAGEPDALAIAPKGEDRIAPTEGEETSEEFAAVTPRKVKTMVVKPDGTLVPREEPAPVAAEQPSALAPVADAEPLEEVDGVADETTATTQPMQTAPAVEEPAAEATAAPVAAEPAAEAPPAEQVAAAAPVAAAAGSWSMQIASQPSAESAQATYEDLARRYGSVIGGKGVNIVKAEIGGKGTYWRVRIPAESKNDAIKLCENYKAAGGNCFVSK